MDSWQESTVQSRRPSRGMCSSGTSVPSSPRMVPPRHTGDQLCTRSKGVIQIARVCAEAAASAPCTDGGAGGGEAPWAPPSAPWAPSPPARSRLRLLVRPSDGGGLTSSPATGHPRAACHAMCTPCPDAPPAAARAAAGSAAAAPRRRRPSYPVRGTQVLGAVSDRRSAGGAAVRQQAHARCDCHGNPRVLRARIASSPQGSGEWGRAASRPCMLLPGEGCMHKPLPGQSSRGRIDPPRKAD